MRDLVIKRKHWVLTCDFRSGLAAIKRLCELYSTLFVMAELRAQEIVTNRDVIPELILKSFLASGVAEQRLIVQQNRPQPKLDIQNQGRAFHQQWYERKIGCVELK